MGGLVVLGSPGDLGGLVDMGCLDDVDDSPMFDRFILLEM